MPNGTVQKTLRARAYIRVSHVGKSRQEALLSDAMQLDEARRYAGYMGFLFDEEASKIHADLDVSGFKKKWRDRPGLMEHYRAAERGEFDVLIFYKISRLARNVREALDMIAEFERLGVAFHFVSEKIDSTSGHGRFVRNVLLSAAEMQSEDTSDFLKAACERRAREGRLHGGTTPAWIKWSKSGTLEVIPEQAEAFRRLVELRLKGLSYPKIARQLNEEGFRTVKGRYWTEGMTYKYLQSSYIQTMRGTGFFHRGRPDEIQIPDAYPAILEEAEAERILVIQKLYSEDYGRKVAGVDWMVCAKRKRGRYSASSIHLLSSLIFCPYCGARMIAFQRMQDARKSPHCYRCPHSRTRPDVHKQGWSSISAESLEDAVLRVIRQALVLPPTGEVATIGKARKGKATDILEELQQKIDSLVEIHLDGHLKEADFERMYSKLSDQRQKLQETANQSIDRVREQAEVLLAQSDLTRAELRQLVLTCIEKVVAPVPYNNITVRGDVKTLRRFAHVTLRFPVEGVQEFMSGLYKADYGQDRIFIAVR